mgnify:CR=1 FL=1
MTGLTKPLKRQRPAPFRCTRPDWGHRIGWAAILLSISYLVARIIPALLSH